jgi:hypothetical protein
MFAVKIFGWQFYDVNLTLNLNNRKKEVLNRVEFIWYLIRSNFFIIKFSSKLKLEKPRNWKVKMKSNKVGFVAGFNFWDLGFFF